MGRRAGGGRGGGCFLHGATRIPSAVAPSLIPEAPKHVRELMKLPEDICQSVEALAARIRREADPPVTLDLVVAGLKARVIETPKT